MTSRVVNVRIDPLVIPDIVRALDWVLDDEKTASLVFGPPSGPDRGGQYVGQGERRARISMARHDLALLAERLKKPIPVTLDFYGDDDT